MIIIGITGTIGAGKGTIVDYLVQKMNFIHYSVRKYLITEITKQNKPVNRDTMVEIANKLRKEHDPAFIIEELYKEASLNNKNAVIESIRTPGEIDLLKTKNNFYLFAIDAAPMLRYNRIFQRQSETDYITFDTFIENEKREMTSNDPTKQNLSACINRADFVLHNNETTEELYMQIDKIFDSILSK